MVINPKQLFGNDYDEFCEKDPFNPKNVVMGFVSRKPTEYYGALIITHVNLKKVSPQLIMGTPKMFYPFTAREDGTRNYRFPLTSKGMTNKIEVYEKLDGTNVLAYTYTVGPDLFVTYKTRLRPFLNEGSKWGKFVSMWNEAAADYKQVIRKMLMEGYNLSFELYGARNPHLVMYKVPLAFALLFAVTNVGNITPPSKLNTRGLPCVPLLKSIDRDYVWNYEQLQKELNNELSQTEDGYYTGVEGTVWYVSSAGKYLQLKCKPEVIETIHFSAGSKDINKQVILATCWNALENVEVLTTDFIKRLLLEEFRPELIESSHYRIERCIEFVKGELVFRDSVLDAYKATGMNILTQKKEVMRAMSSKFDRKVMKKVYSTITNFA